MAESPVLYGLIKKRAALTGDIAHTQKQLRQKLLDLDNLDATILLFDKDYKLESIQPKGFRPESDWAHRGEMTRLILSILRKAAEPLSTRDIALEVMLYKQLDTSNAKAVITMRKRVNTALRVKRRDGLLRSMQGAGQLMLWEIAR